MNFANMPELKWEHSYFAIIIVSVIIVGISIGIFKKNKFF